MWNVALLGVVTSRGLFVALFVVARTLLRRASIRLRARLGALREGTARSGSKLPRRCFKMRGSKCSAAVFVGPSPLVGRETAVETEIVGENTLLLSQSVMQSSVRLRHILSAFRRMFRSEAVAPSTTEAAEKLVP